MTLPDWLDPLYEAAEMRACDAWAIEQRGVPSIDLMERAAAGLARVAAEVAAGRPGPVRIVIGKGNNGGDGLAAARLLREDGHEVDVLAVADPAELRGDALANLERLPGEPPRRLEQGSLEGSAAIVDALLGTGFAGAPREPMASAIRAINDSGAPVVACDVPSGIDASSGERAGEAVRAEATATFHRSKVGLHVEPGKTHAGAVRVVEIGIPRGAPAPGAAGLIADRVAELVPGRSRAGTKFSSGTVVVAGGAAGLTGAPSMAAHGAMRAGAGYVQLAVPASTQMVFEIKLTESMTHALPEEGGAHVEEGAGRVVELARRAGAVVVGPGIGRSEGAFAFARAAARALEAPLVLDADGLNAHAGRLESLRERGAPTVLTPHAGELGRLLGRDSAEVEEHRLRCAREAAERSGAIVLLKGDDTIVAKPGGPVAISPGGSPALATAGTGDVLSGVIAALLARGVEPFAAVCAGVVAHARAGQAAAERLGADHVVAGDVIDALPEAFARMRARRAGV
ncbi:MAG: NAD(P)H-hydrate dehydratase [Thermoleophilaceae bacterium]|nr:NAD(P)H-hydrate dehydratase [Thermoleophilaceae bacterium]